MPFICRRSAPLGSGFPVDYGTHRRGEVWCTRQAPIQPIQRYPIRCWGEWQLHAVGSCNRRSGSCKLSTFSGSTRSDGENKFCWTSVPPHFLSCRTMSDEDGYSASDSASMCSDSTSATEDSVDVDDDQLPDVPVEFIRDALVKLGTPILTRSSSFRHELTRTCSSPTVVRRRQLDARPPGDKIPLGPPPADSALRLRPTASPLRGVRHPSDPSPVARVRFALRGRFRRRRRRRRA